MLARVESAAVAVVASSGGMQNVSGGAVWALLWYACADSRSSKRLSWTMDMLAMLCSRTATLLRRILA